jgi:hypothetical protein
VHYYDEGVQVLIESHNPHKQRTEVKNAEVAQEADAVDGRRKVQGILELEVFVTELELVEKQKDQAVDQHAALVFASLQHRGEHEEVVAEEHPFENQHLVYV